MKKIVRGLTAIAALCVTPAMAADMAVKAPPAPVAAPAYNWSGCYIGGNLGALLAYKQWTSATPGPGFGLPMGSHDVDGPLGGGQVGCDWQMNGRWVLGIAGDYDWANGIGSQPNQLLPAFTDTSQIRSLASVTGRVGYAWDRLLGYVKGGGAWERDHYTETFTAMAMTSATADETRGGWTVGLGGEYAFTNWLSGFVEYDYYNFGSHVDTFVHPSGVVMGFVDIRETKNVFKVGFDVRWDGTAK
jgi:outer membrane immunogenic protein